MSMRDDAPWYKQLWVWLIMLPPAAAVVAGIATVVIAATGADHVLPTDYVKDGLELREDTRRQDTAAALGLGANVHLLRADGRVTVILRGPEQSLPATLTLRMAHPTDAARDLQTALVRDGKVYRGDLHQEAPGRWVLQIEPEDQAWRLAGELAAEASGITLGRGSL